MNRFSIVLYVLKNEIFISETILKKIISDLDLKLKMNFGSNVLSINVVELPLVCSSSLVYFIKNQLEKRVVFRKVIRNAILQIKQSSVSFRGIKIQLSGRLNGAEIARTEWVREGSIPLNTLLADIDYTSFFAL